MSSLILRTATQLLLPLMFLFSLFLLVRGHNEPGGGFVGGLVAAAGFALYIIAHDAAAARRLLRCEPRLLVGAGLLIAVGSGVPSLLIGDPYMKAQWIHFDWGSSGRLDLGTPLLFDLGVYLVVVGATSMILFTLEEN